MTPTKRTRTPAKRARNPKPRGRPFLLIARPDLIEDICVMLASNASYEVAAKACGVSRASILAWRAEGQDLRTQADESDDPDKLVSGLDTRQRTLLDFFDRTTRARGESEVSLLTEMVEHGRKDWRAAAWLLEYVHGYRKTDRVEVTGAGGGPVQVDQAQLRERGHQLINELQVRREMRAEAAARRKTEKASSNGDGAT